MLYSQYISVSLHNIPYRIVVLWRRQSCRSWWSWGRSVTPSSSSNWCCACGVPWLQKNCHGSCGRWSFCLVFCHETSGILWRFFVGVLKRTTHWESLGWDSLRWDGYRKKLGWRCSKIPAELFLVNYMAPGFRPLALAIWAPKGEHKETRGETWREDGQGWRESQHGHQTKGTVSRFGTPNPMGLSPKSYMVFPRKFHLVYHVPSWNVLGYPPLGDG